MKVICIGNRYLSPDGAALWFYDMAVQHTNLSSIEWIEGGLGGMNLSPHFETEQPIVILDYMPDTTNASCFTLDHILQITTANKVLGYDHAHAFYYLLHSLPMLYPSLPKISCMACNPVEKNWQQTLLYRICKLNDLYE